MSIEISQVTVLSGARCLLTVDQLSIGAGQRVAVIGPNGAGKSTLLKVLTGMMPTHSGTVRILDSTFGANAPQKLSAAQWRHLRARVGQVMQGLHLVGRLSAQDNIILGALARRDVMSRWRSWSRIYPTPLRTQADVLLRQFGLSPQRDSRADQLSGGERQKIALARLAMQAPQIILADEPMSALDPTATQLACQFLNQLAQSATMLNVLHDVSLIPLVADRVLGLSQGRIILDCATDALTPEDLQRLYGSDAPERQTI